MAEPLKPKKAGHLGGKEESLGSIESVEHSPSSAELISRMSSGESREKKDSEAPKQRAKYHQASTSGSSMESAQSPNGANSQGKLVDYLNSSSSVETDSMMTDAVSTDSSHTSALSPRSPPETYASGTSPLVRNHSGSLPYHSSSTLSSPRADLPSPRALSPTLSSSRRPKQPKRLQISTIPNDSQESSSSSPPSPHRESSKPLSASQNGISDRDHNGTPNSSDEDAYDDRSTWLARIQHESPVIQDIRQRVRPLARTLNFARTFHVKPDFPVEDILTGAVPPVKRSLNEIAIGLSMQHLHSVGFPKSVGAIHLELDHMAMQPLHMLEEAVPSSTLLDDEDQKDSSESKPYGRRHRKAHKTLADFGRESSFPGGRSSTKDFINTSFHKDQAFFERDRRESPLVTVLRSAMRRAHTIYDTAIADRSSIASLSESQLEELLSSLGLLEDDDDTADDVDIWEEGPDPEEDLNAPRSSNSRIPSNRHTRGDSLSIYMSPNPSQMTAVNSASTNPSSGTSVSSTSTNPAATSSNNANGPSLTTKSGNTSPTAQSTAASGSGSSGGPSFGQGNRGDYSAIGSIIPSTPISGTSSKVSVKGNGRANSSDGGAVSGANPSPTGPSNTPSHSPSSNTSSTAKSITSEVPISSGGGSHPSSSTTHSSGVQSHKPSVSPSSHTSSNVQSSPGPGGMGSGGSGSVNSTGPDGIKGRKLIYDMWADVEDEEERPIRAATLNKLVEVATSSKLSDLNFLPTFLLTYKSFTTSRRLFEKLRQRYNVPMTIAESQGMTPEQFREFVALPIRLRVISFIKRWIQDYPEDIDRPLLAEMKKFVEKLSQTEPGLKLIAASIAVSLDKIGTHIASQSASGSSLYNTISVMGGHGFSFQALMHGFSPYASASALVLTQSQSLGLSGLGSRSNALTSNRKVTIPPGTPPAPKVPKMIFHPSLSLYQIDQEEFARQLTIMDSHVFISIKPSELLNQSWNKPKLKYLAPNVLKMVNMFNQLSHAISAQILQGPKPKDRAKIIEWWIKVAEHCKNLSNYHGLMAVVSGINSGPTVRLKASRREVSKSLLDQLASYEAIFESDGSFSSYRSTLTSSAPPLIPYLGIHLTDLTFIEEGNKDMQGHLINFAKRRLLYQTISGLQNFQQTGYNLQSVRQIQDIIANLKAGEVRDLFKLSLMREPRERS